MIHWGWLFVVLGVGMIVGFCIMAMFAIASELDEEEAIYFGGEHNAETNRTTHLADS